MLSKEVRPVLWWTVLTPASIKRGLMTLSNFQDVYAGISLRATAIIVQMDSVTWLLLWYGH